MIILANLVTIFIVGIGLSMDAFSLSILYGTLSLPKKTMLHLAVTVGIFHFFMPLLGYGCGKTLFNFISINPQVLMGVIFSLIAVQMFLSLTKEEEPMALTGFLSLCFFAFSVSIDSFSVGIGLSGFNMNLFIAPLIFSLTSFTFTISGLVLGKKINKIVGNISTLIGSILLFILGLYYFFA